MTEARYSLAIAERAMAFYRIYLLDGTGRIASATEGEFDGDDEALHAARSQIQVGALGEVWQLGRCLGKVRGGKNHNN